MSAAELIQLIIDNDAASVPSGKTYKVGAITRRPTRKNSDIGLKTKGKGLIVGFSFRRASRSGQPPAIHTGRMINSLIARRIGEYIYRVGTSVLYAEILDNPNKLNRPFFMVIARAYRKTFFVNIRAAYLGK